ncbi:hypothetical protein K504DRAFT_503575 [Pleomassaria siparia CBS 279.74]|uniref:J domain-containing protein n=1 Tax=Pleomassaria siparia CBS 279.74 TaxID=1314801 RepID=A0A6G1K7H1_9PLEO|nr:hypothetical protein K504DRAFT_503575 [Pleomassaria siparia CBS 279.74]
MRNTNTNNTFSTLDSGVFIVNASLHLSRPTTPPASTTSPGQLDLDDYYAVLGIDHWATSEEIKTAYRRLRGRLFQASTLGHYRALQGAFTVLADAETRSKYDVAWRAKHNVPGPGPGPGPVPGSAAPTNLTRARKPTGYNTVSVSERVSKIQTKTLLVRKDSKELLLCQDSNDDDDDDDELELAQEPNDDHLQDIIIRTPLIGTRPYHSYIPILTAYGDEETHPSQMCGRPKYVLSKAILAKP